jgi:SAM-dependent methyltransferase
MSEDITTSLARVYDAKSAGQLLDAYADWAANYDAETLALGYCTPFAILGWLSRYVPPDAGQILDAGCGTGLSGPLLAALGYHQVFGLDFSADMLRAAKLRACYKELIEAELGKQLPFETGRFAAIFCSGVFTLGHAPANAFHELVRVLKSGGHLIFSLRAELENIKLFQDVMHELSGKGIWQAIEISAPFRPFLIGEPDTLVRVHIYRKI